MGFSLSTPCPPAGTQEVRGGAGMRRNLLGPSPPQPPPSFPGPDRAPLHRGPHPLDAWVLTRGWLKGGDGGWRRCLGNILWTAGWTNGRVPPGAGQTSVGGRVNTAQGSQTGGGVKECTHTHSHPKRASPDIQTPVALATETLPARDPLGVRHESGQENPVTTDAQIVTGQT